MGRGTVERDILPELLMKILEVMSFGLWLIDRLIGQFFSFKTFST